MIEARKGPAGGRELDILLYQGQIDVVPMTPDQLQLARDAWRRFGKGRGAAHRWTSVEQIPTCTRAFAAMIARIRR